MKKLILMIIGTIVLYSCKKEEIKPIQERNLSVQSDCGPLGGCWAGTYVCDSAYSAQYSTANPTVQDTFVTGLSVQLIADRDSILPNGIHKVHYHLDSTTNQLSYLSSNTLYVYNNTWLHKNDPWSSYVLFETISGKTMILNKLP